MEEGHQALQCCHGGIWSEDNPHHQSDFFVQKQCWLGEENLTDEEWKEMERNWAEDEQSDWAK